MALNERQQVILECIRRQKSVQNRHIQAFLREKGIEATRITVIRDMETLLQLGLIRKEGEGRGVSYRPIEEGALLEYIDVERYFATDADNRELKQDRFSFGLFDEFHPLLTDSERTTFETMNDAYRRERDAASPAILRKELERVTIELSWKSSQIEGNTYSLIDTEILLKERKEAVGHQREEAVMILNHKRAFDFILENPHRFQHLTLSDIESLHALLIDGLGVERGLRRRPVGITGTRYLPLDNAHQIREAMEKMIDSLNRETHPLERALVAALCVAYIQPFEDGNKRTSRLLANALLLAGDYAPLSFRSIDEAEYKKAVVLFYEQNSARYFKELFLEQFTFSIRHAFGGIS